MYPQNILDIGNNDINELYQLEIKLALALSNEFGWAHSEIIFKA